MQAYGFYIDRERNVYKRKPKYFKYFRTVLLRTYLLSFHDPNPKELPDFFAAIYLLENKQSLHTYEKIFNQDLLLVQENISWQTYLQMSSRLIHDNQMLFTTR